MIEAPRIFASFEKTMARSSSHDHRAHHPTYVGDDGGRRNDHLARSCWSCGISWSEERERESMCAKKVFRDAYSGGTRLV